MEVKSLHPENFPGEPESTPEIAKRHGLTEEEYKRILGLLGRVPTYTELGIYSVMWSEHCSYKNSIAVLKTLPRSGGRLLVSAGEENAGLVDIGDGLAVAFKIESHNHPSAVEPYQGAATGVGGIMRDIFTMGARPIASLNSLRFGDLKHPHTRFLVDGVVRGIGDYGNSFGVPTVAGEVYFDPCYHENPLVNAMSVGIVKHGEWASATAKGTGNPVMIVGSATGRDGIHGATFASEEISEESEKKRPSVQVGDPFTEKLLLEATLEAIRTGYVVGIQDMGAAGIICSTSEMSARGKCGMEVNLDHVPARETGMSAYELMLSESQERMLVVVEKGHEDDVRKVFGKWDLHAEIVGEVIDGDRLIVHYRGKTVADVSPDSLVLGGGAPVYKREARKPDYIDKVRPLNADSVPVPPDLMDVLLALMGDPNIASKKWVYDQYDSMVRTNNVVLAGADAAVIAVQHTNKGLALKTDCNGRYVYLNPRVGGMIAVAEAGRNVACTGAAPVAITNCLNFGNPYKPGVYWQFTEAVAGISEACRLLGTPVTGGNVSFYNESPTTSVFPTPVIGMLGVLEDVRKAKTAFFKRAGDRIYLLGTCRGHIGGSEYLAVVHGMVAGDAPPIDLDEERRLQALLVSLVSDDAISSAHDCSEGGIAVALAECCILHRSKQFGARVKLPWGSMRRDAVMFGEDQSRVVVSVEPEKVLKLQALAQSAGIAVTELGEVTNEKELVIDECGTLGLETLDRVYNSAIGERMEIN
jgi:phosphoribosylformylglycinamidine synthase subunit PurL